MSERGRIVRFVRETLGCTCPEEVFEQLSWGFIEGEAGLPRRFRIDVGGRLLVEAVEATTLDAESVRSLLRAGRGGRDGGGYNRFRLALIAPDDASSEALLSAFAEAAVGDEKLHVHRIDKGPWAE